MRHPRTPLMLGLLGMACLGPAALAAQKPDTGVVLNRMTSAYRSMQSYRDSGTLTQKAGEKTYKADVSLAAERPNRYALEIKGDKVNTQVWSDGTTLVALRPDRKAYTKTKAPNLLFKADVLGKVDVPAPASRLVTYLLENTLRTSEDAFPKALQEGETTEPQPFGNKMAYVIKSRYDDELDARVYVTADDFLVRKVTLLRAGEVVATQTLGEIETGKSIDVATFSPKFPEAARVVYSLPPLEGISIAASGPMEKDFTLDTYQGGKVTLSNLKGKVVLLNFFFNN